LRYCLKGKVKKNEEILNAITRISGKGGRESYMSTGMSSSNLESQRSKGFESRVEETHPYSPLGRHKRGGLSIGN